MLTTPHAGALPRARMYRGMISHAAFAFSAYLSGRPLAARRVACARRQCARQDEERLDGNCGGRFVPDDDKRKDHRQPDA
jgi:hypothetical protein